MWEERTLALVHCSFGDVHEIITLECGVIGWLCMSAGALVFTSFVLPLLDTMEHGHS